MQAKYLSGILLLAMGLGLGTFTACNDEDDYTISKAAIMESVTTGSAEVTATSATLSGSVKGLEGQSSSAYTVGFYYIEGQGDPKQGTRTVGTYSDGIITASVGDLRTGVEYSYCAFVTLQGRVNYYGDVKTFTTIDAKVYTHAASDVTGATATFSATMEGTSGISLTTGYKLGLTLNADSLKAFGADYNIGELETSEVTFELKGLLPNTVYYYLPYVNLGTSYVYGEVGTFTTKAVEFEYVDLGLSVMWATFNVGAEQVGETGGTYAYGDATGLKQSQDLADYPNTSIIGSGDDIAKAIGAGHLPSLADVKELINSCQYKYGTVDGVEGATFTAPNGNSIFLPAASGYWTGTAASSGIHGQTFEVNASSSNLSAELLSTQLCVRPVTAAPFSIKNLYQTWQLDVDEFGDCYYFNGPVWFYGTDDDYNTVSEGTPAPEGADSWSWTADFAGNSWATPGGAKNYGTMTFNADGTVDVNGTSGTFTFNAKQKTLTLSIPVLNPDENRVSNLTTDLKILALGKNNLQIGVIRDADPCLLSYNYVSKSYYDENSKPVWQGVPASLNVSDPNWSPSIWANADYKLNADVTGFGTYTAKAKLDGAINGVNVFTVDILGYTAFFGEQMRDITVARIDQILIDGNEVACDNSKIKYGDIEGNGNFRIEIYNDYGSGTADNPPIDKSQMQGSEVEVTFTIESLAAEAMVVISDPNWSPSNWGTPGYAGNAIVNGYGQYTCRCDIGGAINGVNVFCVDITNFTQLFGEEMRDNTVAEIDKIEIDGKEVACDNSKILYGDIEGNGKFRIEIYNDYGAGTAQNPPIDKSQMQGQNVAVTFTLKEKVKGYNVNFMTCDTNWNWKDHSQTMQLEAGHQYTVTAADAQTNGMIDCVDLEGFAADYPGAILRVDDIKVDGQSIAFDPNKIGHGDIEGKGNYRIELFNCYGNTSKQGTDAFGGTSADAAAALACNEKIELTFTVVTLDGFSAGLTTCDSNWNSSWPDASTPLCLNNVFPIEYTVTVEGSRANGMIDLVEVQNVMAQFPNIQLTLQTVRCDGQEVAFDASKILYGDLEGKGNYRIELYNTYGSSKGNAAFAGESDGIIPGLGFNEKMEVTFTLDKLF